MNDNSSGEAEDLSWFKEQELKLEERLAGCGYRLVYDKMKEDRFKSLVGYQIQKAGEKGKTVPGLPTGRISFFEVETYADELCGPE